MNCPYCQKELQAPDYAYYNADTYGQKVNVLTHCCHNIVEITPIRSYRIKKSDVNVDDWGAEKGTKE